MREQLEKRWQELKSEFEAGQKVLAELEARQVNLRETLLRISGAMQVLEEELNKATQINTPSEKNVVKNSAAHTMQSTPSITT